MFFYYFSMHGSCPSYLIRLENMYLFTNFTNGYFDYQFFLYQMLIAFNKLKIMYFYIEMKSLLCVKKELMFDCVTFVIDLKFHCVAESPVNAL